MSHSLKTHLDEIVYLKSIKSLLSWDQETQMPSQGAAFRAEECALVESLIQDRILDPKIANFLSQTGLDAESKRHQFLLRDDVEKHSLPKDLVERIAKHSVSSVESWRMARQEKDFSLFENDLQVMIRLNQEVADILKKDQTRYDALLSFYDRDLTYANIEKLFAPLEKKLTYIIQEKKYPKRIPKPVPASIEAQKKICELVAKRIAPGSLLKESTHPFCDMLGPNDIRLTTRYNPMDLFEALFSTLHELGHALYDQQLPHEKPYPLNQALSLTVHESQSKLFETCIGGSCEFLEYLHHLMQEHIPGFNLPLKEMILSRHAISPNPIRIDSDEFTYPLHIIFRTKIERDLIEGNLQVKDLPHVFREYQKNLLGLEVDNDAEGCLQDIHWAAGYFGYFPTYLTGCMFAADQYATMKEHFDLTSGLTHGEIDPVSQWLKQHIHRYGSTLGFNDLLNASTKKELSSSRYFNYLESRFLN